MLHILIVPGVQQYISLWMEKLAMLKTHPYYLSPPWGLWPLPCLGRLRDRTT